MALHEGDIVAYKPKEGDFDAKGRYRSALEARETFVGNVIRQKQNWQRFAFTCLLSNIICVVGIVYLAMQGELVPYVVERDMQTGQAVAVGRAVQKEYIPQEAENRYFLAKFIEYTRTIPLDPVLYRRNWNNAMAFLTPPAADKINRLVAEEGQAAQIGRRTVLPRIIAIQLMAGTKDVYQIRWVEENFIIQGVGEEVNVVMSGTFSVEYARPKTEGDLLINPLGVRIRDFSWVSESVIHR